MSNERVRPGLQFRTPRWFMASHFWAFNAGRISVRRFQFMLDARNESNPIKRAMYVEWAKKEHRNLMSSLRDAKRDIAYESQP